MTPILQAAAQGYSSQQILKYLQNAFPRLTPKIMQASANGYSVDQILKFVNKLMESETFSSNATPHEIEAAHQKKYNEYGKKILGAAATGIGLTSFAKNLPSLVRTLGSSISPMNIGPNPMGNAPVQPEQPTNPQASQTQQPISLQQPTPQPTPQPASQPSINPQQSASIIKKLGIAPQIQSMQKFGHSPESISSAVGLIIKPNQRKWLDEQIKAGKAKPIPDLITDYLAQNNQEVSGNPAVAENMQNQPVLEPNAKAKPQKGELVATPSGDIGEIKSERNGKALVDVNGKLHQTEAKDLELPNEELIKAVENLLNLPEIEKSAVISSLVYRPSKKEMFVKFHNGERYVYEDVDEEEIRPIAEAMGIPVTTGQNIFGAWEKGKQDSRGAALIHGIIRNAKYAKDNEGKTWEKLETKYDRYKKLYKQPKRKRKEP